jgi:hypothetical protein
MNAGRTLFAQVMDFAPWYHFDQCVARYDGDQGVRRFSCRDQFLCMAFAQLTERESLRDIEACLRAREEKLYHMGFRGGVSRSTLADANEKRDWRIYADFAQALIDQARYLYCDEPLGIELRNTIYALDSTTIDLCLSLFPWARFRRTKGAIKLHTLLDLRGSIPSFIEITHGKVHDVNILDQLVPEPGSVYVMDRGYVDFGRLYMFTQCLSIFVIRAKKNLQFERLYSSPVDRKTGLFCDQTIRLTGTNAVDDYPDHMRRIRYRDAETETALTLLTNDFTLPALTVTDIYRLRWKVELFFKWIKQHLRIKSFYGTSSNAVKTQVWIAISVYVMVAILRKQLSLDRDLYTILQILSVTMFEKVPIAEALTASSYTSTIALSPNQLQLFDL